MHTGSDVTACAGGSLDELSPLTASTGMIKSPGYDENVYPNNANCLWLITAPPGQVSMIQQCACTLFSNTVRFRAYNNKAQV